MTGQIRAIIITGILFLVALFCGIYLGCLVYTEYTAWDQHQVEQRVSAIIQRADDEAKTIRAIATGISPADTVTGWDASIDTVDVRYVPSGYNYWVHDKHGWRAAR
ncbi:MAG: hypothetical protein ABFC94_15725 [Syntrophomonas sp.]